MNRVVEAELLDQLPPDDPHAIHSRRDLQRLNRLMGSVSNLAVALADHPKPSRVMDIGAGDGTLSLALARKLQWKGTEFVLVDRTAAISNQTSSAFASMQCPVTLRCCEVPAGLEECGQADIIFANLFLHHFAENELRQLLADIAQRCGMFVGCEPRRSSWSLLASHCIGALGCDAVTRHDAVISVRAGFNGDELSRLWRKKEGWSLKEHSIGLFSHLFVARKL